MDSLQGAFLAFFSTVPDSLEVPREKNHKFQSFLGPFPLPVPVFARVFFGRLMFLIVATNCPPQIRNMSS